MNNKAKKYLMHVSETWKNNGLQQIDGKIFLEQQINKNSWFFHYDNYQRN